MQYIATDDSTSYEKVYLVYKFDFTPREVIIEGMQKLGSWEDL